MQNSYPLNDELFLIDFFIAPSQIDTDLSGTSEDYSLGSPELGTDVSILTEGGGRPLRAEPLRRESFEAKLIRLSSSSGSNSLAASDELEEEEDVSKPFSTEDSLTSASTSSLTATTQVWNNVQVPPTI